MGWDEAAARVAWVGVVAAAVVVRPYGRLG